MAGRFIPPSEQYFDNSGNILSGGLLYFYDSGTAVAKDTYSDPDGAIPNTNPVVLDAAGRTPNIYLDGSYKLIIRDSAGVQIEERDPVLAADDTTKGFAVWNAVTTYDVDDIVRASNNLLYISIAASNQNFEPSANATKWTRVQLLSSYNANETYAIGDVVIDSIGDIYRSLTNSNTGNTPASSPTDWTTVVAGAFSGNVTVGGTLDVTGATTLSSTLASQGITTTGNTPAGAASAGEGRFFPNNTFGALVYGKGATYDVALGRDNTNVALGVLTGTQNLVALGGLAVTGALSKGSGSFRIDHPLKPDTHQLVHSFTESPQADLLYSGTVDLVNGEAEINLDEYHGMTEGTFVALNRNIRVFTTNESDWEPIKGYVIGNVLHISCQDATCSDSVSWLVIGERHDKHMMDTDWTDDQGRVIVEPEKVIPPEPTYVQRTITVEVEGETQIKTEKVAEHVEIIDGVATLIPESTKKVEVPLTKEVLVFNADGSPVMVQV